MLKIHKLIIGIRPVTRMFRIPAIGGLAIDAILDIRGKSGGLSNDYYTQIQTSNDASLFQLHNPDNGNLLKIDRDNIIFVKDSFGLDFEIDRKKAIEELWIIWKVINPIVEMRDIRRIGIAAEHVLDIDKPNKTLLDTLTKFNSSSHPAKFHLSYEDRKPTKEAIAPDIKKDDFLNIISEFYDSEMDIDHPESGFINVNLDVQRYFAPHLTKLSDSELAKQLKTFEQQRQLFFKHLTDMGLVLGEK